MSASTQGESILCVSNLDDLDNCAQSDNLDIDREYRIRLTEMVNLTHQIRG
jgi:hypothetical protein